MLNISIIEDDQMQRLVLAKFFNEQEDTHCVSVAESVEAFLNTPFIEGTTPDLILCDIELPGRSGIEGIQHIKRRFPAAEVLMLSVYTDSERVFQALCEGAVGYLEKSTPLPLLKKYVLEVQQGGSPMSPSVARHVVRYFQPRQRSTDALTPREQQIVHFIEEGLTYKQIATRLSISLDTVRNHLRAVYRKLQVNSRAQVIARHTRRDGPAASE